ncbi:MAG: cytochrome c3 family protein [Betaproteobacteria bacterium]
MLKYRTLAAFVVCCAVASAAAPVLAETAKPQFLADKHIAAGLTCASCHGQGKPASVPTTTCLSCHGSYQELAKKTASLRRNPHDSHYPDLECDSCHHGHRAQEDFCGTCHG